MIQSFIHSHRDELKSMSKLALPAILSQLAQMGLGLIDTLMAAQLGDQALAALSVGINILNPTIVLMMGIFLALNPIVAQFNGQKDYHSIGQTLSSGLVLSLILMIPTLIILMHGDSIMASLSIQPSIIPEASAYLKSVSLGIFGLFIFLVFRFINEGLFATKVVMITALSALPLNVLFNYAFMYGLFGFPKMGVAGLGWATSCVWLYMAIVLAIYTFRTEKYRHIEFVSQLKRLNRSIIIELIKVGTPISLSIGLEILMFSVVGLMIGAMPIEKIASHQIANNLSSMTFMIPLGISIAITARAGFAAGKYSIEGIKQVIRVGYVITLIAVSLNALFLLIWHTEIAKLYTENQTLITLAAQLILLAAIYQISDGLQIATQGVLRGIKDTKIPMWLTLAAYWVIGFPSGYYMAINLEMGPKGFWIGFIIGLTFAAMALIWRLKWILQTLKKVYHQKQYTYQL